MKEKIENINIGFIDYFKGKNYKLKNSVDIISGIDPSVFFVGSAISVLKPILLNDKIDTVGNIVTQKAIRTRTLSRIEIPEKLEWSSFFNALGVLVNYDKIEDIIGDVFTFLHEIIGINYSDISVNINSKDNDLIKALNSVNPGVNILVDKKPELYYKHRYGLDNLGIYGRNFNIAIRDKKDNIYKDIGNIIVIEDNNKKYGVEYAAGVNAILMRTEGIDNSIEASAISDIVKVKELGDYKFADCLSVVSHLAYENIEYECKNKRSPLCTYRKYLKELYIWKEKLNIDNDILDELIRKYIILEYNDYDADIINYNLKLIKK